MKYFKLLIFLFSFQTLANMQTQIPKSECTDVDIRSSMGEEMKEHFSTPRDQNLLGWCYAFSGADLISAQIGKPISSKHISAIYNKVDVESESRFLGIKIPSFLRSNETNENKIREYGRVNESIKYASREKYICLEKDLPFDGDYQGQTKDLVSQVEYVKDLLESSIYSNEIICSELHNLKNQFPIDLKFFEIYSILNEKEINKAFEEIITNKCKGKKIAIDKYDTKSFTRVHPKNFKRYRSIDKKKKLNRRIKRYYRKVDKFLKQGKPMAISYDLSHISPLKGLHSSILTARRWKDGSCQFKIRNSWGKSCQTYLKSEIKECIKDEGSYWIDDNKFYEMVLRIDIID